MFYALAPFTCRPNTCCPTGKGRGRQQLPDRFRLARPSSTLPVEVFIHRTIELGTWLLDAKVGIMAAAMQCILYLDACCFLHASALCDCVC